MYGVQERVGAFSTLAPREEDDDGSEECASAAAGATTGWLVPSTDGDGRAALRDRRPRPLRGRRRLRLVRRVEERAQRGRGPLSLGAGGPLGAAQRSWRPGRRAGAPGAAGRLRPDGPTGRAARAGRLRADRGLVDVFRPFPEPLRRAVAA